MHQSTNNNLPEWAATFAPQSSVWVFASQRLITNDISNAIDNELKPFINQWNAHGTQLSAAYTILHHHFIIIAVDANVEPASGCSIDKLTHTMQAISTSHQLELFDRLRFFYYENNAVQHCAWSQRQSAIKAMENEQNPTIFYFQNHINTIEQLNNQWCKPHPLPQ
jgi:hypothetical protein